jgi:hypothetical protein
MTTQESLLEEFCKDVEKNGELIRCCSCSNTLAMAGKYEIQPIEDRIIPFLPNQKVQGLVCERCVQIGRKPVKAVVVIGQKGSDLQRVTYINIDDLAKPGTTTGAESTTVVIVEDEKANTSK